MGNGTKLKHQWEIKKRENGFDSPSKESNSSQSPEPIQKKHKLVSSLILLKKDEAIDRHSIEQSGEIGLCSASQTKLEKGKRKPTERSKRDSLTNNDLKRGPNRNLSEERSTETTANELVAIDDVKLLMESLLEDLKVKRENLFTWLKEEMQKMLADDIKPQLERKECSYREEKVQVHNQEIFEEEIEHNQNNIQENIQVCQKKIVKENNLVQDQNYSKENFHIQQHNKFPGTRLHLHDNFKDNIEVQFKPDMRDQNSNAGSLERSLESNEESDFDNCYETLEDLDDFGDSRDHISVEKDRKESLALNVKPNIQSCPANHSDQMQHRKKNPSATTSENCNGGALESYVEGKRLTDPNCHQGLKYQVDYDQEIEFIRSSPEKKGENFGLSLESNTATRLLNQVASSMYLKLPNEFSGQPCFDNHRLEISSCNCIQPIVTGSRIGKSLEGANNQGKFAGLQHEERNRSFARLNSGNVVPFIQGGISNSVIGTGFPNSLSQNIDTGFSLPRNQFSFENQTQEKTNISGFKVDGGALSFSGGSYALSEHYVANKFGSHSNNKAESRLNSFPNLRSQ